MVLDKIKLRDFLTYKELEYTFEKRPVLVQGQNLTDDGQESNGSGKSGLQTGIEFCITASNSRDVRDAELVTYGKKEAQAELFASCDVRKETIHIFWTIRVKGSNILKLQIRKYGDKREWGDEELNVPFSNVNDGKKFIMSWFAITKEDLFNYYLINNSRFKSFFKSSNTEKVDLINRFSDASIVDGLENLDKTEVEEEYRAAERACDVTQGKIEHITEQLEKERNRDFAEELKEKKEELQDEIEYLEEKIESVQDAEIDSKENILDTQEEIKEIRSNIQKSKEEKVKIQESINTIGSSIDEATDVLKNAEASVENFPETNWQKERKTYLESLSDKQRELERIKSEEKISSQENQLLDFINKLNIKLGGAITCPNCKHEFVLEGDIDEIKEKKETAESLTIKIEEKKQRITSTNEEIRESIEALEETLSKINEKESKENREKNKLSMAVIEATRKLSDIKSHLRTHTQELKECDNEILSFEREIVSLEKSIEVSRETIEEGKDRIKRFNSEIKDVQSQIENLKAGSNKEYVSTLKKDLKTVEKLLETQKLEHIAIGDRLYEMNQWSNNFKQFRMFLANQSLSVIEYHCNRYLSGMGSDLLVKMEGFRVLANGSLKEEITAKILRNGERSFSSFSGGEKGRLLFASILSNRHLINETHPYGGLDFLSIDEVFEGVDSIGLKHLIESAKELSITVMIITHVTDEKADSDTVTIIKENNVSRIKE
jgi:DNA repair protein SbcC/Rad50